MTTGMQKTLAWSGVAFVLMLFPGLLMAGMLPPFAPSRTAEQVAQFWSTNTGLKRCGLVIIVCGAGLQVPFGVLIAARIRRLEGRSTPLAYGQLIGLSLGVIAIVLPIIVFAAASYRPERDPQITQALNDFGWLLFIMNWPAATIQCLTIAFAIFGYRGTQPVWPRWLAYYNLWSGFILAAGGLAVLFKDGVFAWNGLLAFWMAAVFFGVWFFVMTWQLLASIPSHEAADVDDAAVIGRSYPR